MLLHVVIVGHLGVQRRVDAAAEQQLKRLVQIVDAGHGRTVLLGQLGVGAGDRVCGVLAVQVFQRVDAVVVLRRDDGGAVKGVGGREIVFLGALRRDVDAVHHNVVAAGVETGQQAVPLTLNELRLDTQLLGDLRGDLDVVADEVIVLVVVRPRCPGSLHRDGDGALGLNLAQQVAACGLGRLGTGGVRRALSGGGVGGTAAGSQPHGQRGGQGQGGQFRKLLHYTKLLCL